MLSNSTPSTATTHGRRGLVIRAMALASLAVAGFVLPFVWDVLEFINQLPKMAWLQNLLAQQLRLLKLLLQLLKTYKNHLLLLHNRL